MLIGESVGLAWREFMQENVELLGEGGTGVEGVPRRRCHINRLRRSEVNFGRPGSGCDTGHGFPLRHGVQTMKMCGEGGATGTGRDEQVADGGEYGDEPLQGSLGSKALHRPLSPSQGQMRILGPVVEALVRAMLDRRHDLAAGGGIGRLGGQPCFSRRRISKCFAASVSRCVWTISSRM